MSEDTTEQIRRFILRHTTETELADDLDIFDTGHVNSLFAVQLVMWLEQSLDVVAQDADLDIANFRTVAAIASFVHRKRSASNGETGSSDAPTVDAATAPARPT